MTNIELQDYLSARERNRTFTPLRMADFESAASTNSATRASGSASQYYYFNIEPLAGCNITHCIHFVQNAV